MTKQLKNNLTRLQKAQNLTISGLARTTGVSRRTIDRILGRDIDVRGATILPSTPYHPTFNTLVQLADTFGVSTSDVTKRLPSFVIQSVQPA